MKLHEIINAERKKNIDAWKAAGGSVRRIKILRGYTEHARYLDATHSENVGYVPRMVDTPYVSSPSHTVFATLDGRNVFIAETAQRRYEVFEIVSGPIALEDM